MRETGLPGAFIFLLLRAPAGISSESSSFSILHHAHRRFCSILNPRLDDEADESPPPCFFHLPPSSCADCDLQPVIIPFHPPSVVSPPPPSNGGVFSSVGNALRCFGAMMKMDPLPSPKEFSLLLGAVARMKHYSTAIRLIEQMRSLGIEDDHVLLTISLNCFCRLKRVDLGLSILGRILKLGFPITVVASSTLIDGLFIQGKTEQALRFLDDMGRNGPEPNEMTYAIVAKGLCRAGNTRLAIELLRDWEERSCRLNCFAYGIIIDSLCKEGMITEALRLHKSLSRCTCG